MKSLSIGEIARQAGVGVEAVRFYERQGLFELGHPFGPRCGHRRTRPCRARKAYHPE